MCPINSLCAILYKLNYDQSQNFLMYKKHSNNFMETNHNCKAATEKKIREVHCLVMQNVEGYQILLKYDA